MADEESVHFEEATNNIGYCIAIATEDQYVIMNNLHQKVAAQITEETEQKHI